MKRLLALLAGFVLAVTNASVASAATSAAVPAAHPAVAEMVRTQAQAPAATWTDWDGFLITSAANCESRRQTIAATYHIGINNLRCQRRNVGLPPCPLYRWVLQVKSADSFARHDGVDVPAEQSDGTAAPLC